MRLNQIKIYKDFTASGFLILIAFAWYIMPIAKFYILDMPAFLYISALCLYFSITNKRRFKVFFTITTLNILIALSVSAFNFGLKFQPFYASFIHLQLFFSPAIIFLYVHDRMSNKAIRTMLHYCTLILIVCFVSSFTMLLQYPEAARSLASQSAPMDLIVFWRKSNVGGFNLTYSFGLIFLLIFYSVERSRGIRKSLPLICLGFLSYFFIMAQYATLMVLVAACSLLMHILNKSKSALSYITTFILLILCYMALPPLLMWFTEFLDSPILIRRLTEIAVYMQTGESGVSLTSRFDCYTAGIEWFLKSPFYGNRMESYGGIDIWHSTIIGYMVRTGLIGTFMYIYQFFHVKNIVSRYLTRSDWKHIMKSCVIYVLVLSILNPIDSAHEIPTLLFFYIPLIVRKRNGYSKKTIRTV